MTTALRDRPTPPDDGDDARPKAAAQRPASRDRCVKPVAAATSLAGTGA